MCKQRGKKLYLITGFLGSGKTTFMHNLIDAFKDEKIALIVNEFGKQGIDGLLLQEEDIALKEISNGSIFCNCRSDTFVEALLKMAEFEVEDVLIESSGLSDPTGMSKILSLVQKKTDDCYDYRGNITLVDATNFEKLFDTAAAVKLQIASSDLILLNKTDLVEESKLDSVEQTIRQVNPLAPIKRTTYGEIKDLSWIADLNNDNSSGDINITKKIIIGTQKILVAMEGTYSKENLMNWIKDFSEYFYRIKGFVRIEEEWHYIDGTTNQLEIKKTDIVPEQPSLVILAAGSQPVLKNLRSSWEKYFEQELVLL